MSSAKQLALDLGHRPALERDDFFVAESNAEAVAWLDRWPDWPGQGIAIFGPPGCGKSHLMSVWQARSGARLLPAVRIAGAARTDRLINGIQHIAFDAADEHIANGTLPERRMLHLYNAVRESGGTVMIAARTPPARWNIELPDLRSRLAALPAVEVGAPDDGLIAAILVKLFADRQLAIDQDVLRYMLTRMERSFDAAMRLVDRVDEEALSRGRGVTVPLVRSVLQRIGDIPDGQ